MPLWPIKSQPLQQTPFERIVPDETLLEFNGASTFTFRDRNGTTMLAHFCDDEDERLRYFVAPTSDSILSRLKAGDLSIRAALDQPLAWLADVDRQGVVLTAWQTRISLVPQDALPAPDVILRPGTLPKQGATVRQTHADDAEEKTG